MIKTLSISLLLAIGLIFSGYLIGNKHDVYTLETIKTESIIQTEIYWQTETVEKIVEVTIYPELREFESREELVSWLSGKQVWNKGWNCVDYSYDLQMKAQRDGYYMTLWTLTPDQYDWWFGTENIEYWWGAGVTHMVCGVIIENQVYLIDPSASLKVYPEEGQMTKTKLMEQLKLTDEEIETITDNITGGHYKADDVDRALIQAQLDKVFRHPDLIFCGKDKDKDGQEIDGVAYSKTNLDEHDVSGDNAWRGSKCQYQYLTVHLPSQLWAFNDSNLQEFLDARGKDGWSLKCVVKDQYLIFERWTV